jgi:hypothetical protein
VVPTNRTEILAINVTRVRNHVGVSNKLNRHHENGRAHKVVAFSSGQVLGHAGFRLTEGPGEWYAQRQKTDACSARRRFNFKVTEPRRGVRRSVYSERRCVFGSSVLSEANDYREGAGR